MKITLSYNIDTIGCTIEGDKMEVIDPKTLTKEGAEKFAKGVHKNITDAYRAAQLVWKKYPHFKQVTFDTSTDEERNMIIQAERAGGGAA